MTQPVAIDVERLDKTFRIPEHRVHTLKERALHPFRPTRYHELRVLEDISFEVRKGEFFGILGRNGSGKSTLLKCLAGIYKTDAGRLRVGGRLAPFIELGVGFNPDLTARENVVINAVMMGLSPADARARFDDIIRFAELDEFVELKLKNYSSGMHVRLAFSTMVQSDADVLLIDEVLAVGDAAFQRKCFDVFDDLHAGGKTIVLVTHDVGLVRRFCDRAMLIDKHRIDAIGAPDEITRRYLDVNFLGSETVGAEPTVAGRAQIREVWVSDERGQRATTTEFGQQIQIFALIEAREELIDPEVRIQIENEAGVRVFAASTLEFEHSVDPFAPGEQRVFAVRMENRLVSATYAVNVLVRSRERPEDVSAVEANAARFAVVGGDHVGGIYDIDHEVALEPVRGGVPT